MSTSVIPDELREYFDDPLVTDVLINDGTDVWIERDGALRRVATIPARSVDVAIERLLAPLGRRLDRLSPMVDARLSDGTRVCAVVPPVSIRGVTVAFRKFRDHVFTLDDFTDERTASTIAARLSRGRGNVLVTGATGSGKTSLLAALASASPPDRRLVVLEDTSELVIDHPHVVRLETRSASADGRGEVTLCDLVRTSLRLRPDRLIVGEVRGVEAFALAQALNTGHSECLATVHASSALEGLRRLDLLVLQGALGWDIADARSTVNTAFDMVIHLERDLRGRRRVAHAGTVHDDCRRLDIFVDHAAPLAGRA